MSGIIRIEKSKNYSVVSNVPANDKNLSWEARGVLYYLLTKPDGWICRNQDLANNGPAGGDKIERIMDELQEHGYVTRKRYQVEGTGLFEWETTIYEIPVEPEQNVKDRIARKRQKAAEKRQKMAIKQQEETVNKNSSIGVLSTNGSSTYGSSTNGKHPHIVSTDEENTDKESATKTVAPAEHRAPVIPGNLPPVNHAYKVFVEVTKKHYLNKVQMQVIEQVVGETPEALEKWKMVVTAWNLAGYKITNVTGMLDWFVNGIPKYKSNSPSDTQKVRISAI